MHQTLKHVSIFIVFLIVSLGWKGAEVYARHIIPRFHREAITIFIWSVMLVVFWHALFYYLGKISEKAVYIITLVSVFCALVSYGTIKIF